MAVGQAGSTLPVEIFDRDDRSRLARGTLALVDNRIDRGTNTIRLKAIFDNATGTLRPGEFVNAHLLKTVLRGVMVVPKEVVQYDEQGSFAWRLRPDSSVEPRRIVVGPENSGLVAVERGLSAGDRVVLDGQYNLRAGVTVTVQTRAPAESAANSNALILP
jgi:multidrug efflux system membrane fusion protein